ncbi:hypothetical protein TNCV_4536301 [Trichonephila clavipes]|nr:hypothetical protein TNCV_4536301 [Trichonephila clavipes]
MGGVIGLSLAFCTHGCEFMSHDYTACERSLECLFGLSALGKIKYQYRFALSRAQVPPSEEETGCQNYLRQLVSPIWCPAKK